MRKSYMDFITFILSSVSFLISIELFWKMAIYVDDSGISPDIIQGGAFWSSMDVLRILILGILSIILLLRLFNEKYK